MSFFTKGRLALAAGIVATSRTYTQTNYPIVLVHGFSGFDRLFGLVDYFYPVPEALSKDGAKAFMAQGFFGEEEAAFEALLARKRIQASETLCEAERQRALDALEQYRPEEVRAIREQAVSVVTVRRQVEELRARGASEQEIFNARAAQFGVESAERLAKLDRERQSWDQRLQAYREQKTQIESRSDLAADAREQAIEALRGEHFAEHEV